MICIVRPTVPPTSLSNVNVQNFVAQHAAYKANPNTAPKPKRPTGYRNSDLLTAFDTYFFAKCYLTEQKFASAWEMDVDHFVPVNQNPARVLDWTNLFPAAHKANIMRPSTLPSGGLLDPCVDDVETDIVYSLVDLGEKPGFRALNSNNIKAVNTATLLDELHNGKQGNPDSYKSTLQLRYLIERQYKKVLFAWGNYTHAHRVNNPQDIAEAEEELKVLLSRKSSFTMLMRSLKFIRTTVPQHLLD